VRRYINKVDQARGTTLLLPPSVRLIWDAQATRDRSGPSGDTDLPYRDMRKRTASYAPDEDDGLDTMDAGPAPEEDAFYKSSQARSQRKRHHKEDAQKPCVGGRPRGMQSEGGADGWQGNADAVRRFRARGQARCIRADPQEQRCARAPRVHPSRAHWSPGLTPRRPKEQRNPRVRLRKQFEDAKKRRKGAVRDVRPVRDPTRIQMRAERDADAGAWGWRNRRARATVAKSPASDRTCRGLSSCSEVCCSQPGDEAMTAVLLELDRVVWNRKRKIPPHKSTRSYSTYEPESNSSKRSTFGTTPPLVQ
jgi:hypothetical protein